MKKIFTLLITLTACMSLCFAATHTITSTTGSDSSGSFRDIFANAGNKDVIEFDIPGSDVIKLTGSLQRTKKNTKITVNGINKATGNPITINANSYSVFRSSSSSESNVRDGVSVSFNNMIFKNASNSSHGGGFCLGHSSHTNMGTFEFKNCTFENCQTTAKGGAIGINKNITLIIDCCTFKGNSATAGGAIGTVSAECFITVTNSTFYQNTAGTGGAMFCNSVNNSSINNCTIVGNTSTEPSGAISSTDNAFMTLTNCIASGSNGSTNSDVYGDKIVLINSIVEQTDETVTSVASNPLTFDASVFMNSTPVLADNGGVTQTIAISDMGAAYRSGIAGAGIPQTDQRGVVRNAVPCIGSYEHDGISTSIESSDKDIVSVNADGNQLLVLSKEDGTGIIYDINGQIVDRISFSGNSTLRTVVSDGIYIVKLTIGKDVIVRKIKI